MPFMEHEEWREIPGFSGIYEASSLGRIRSLDTTTMQRGRGGRLYKRRHAGRVLHQRPYDKYGHVMTTLSSGGACFHRAVHGLVLSAFGRPRPVGMECRHLDGRAWNNRADNLAWGTPKQNQADRKLHGTSNAGERNGQCKLTASKVKKMRALYEYGESQDKLARRFGVSQTQVSRIVRGKKWGLV